MPEQPDRHIIHVDMDAFFASVEQRDDPQLRGRPVLVGGRKRGVVCAASYEARPFGVHSAMSMQTALRLCPDAFVVSPRHSHYAAVSREVFAIFRRYTPIVQGLSLDEAFLDVTQSLSLFGSAELIAQQIRADIRRELGLIASAGVASTKFVAKLASDANKPDGLCVVLPQNVLAFLAPLPVGRLMGVGKVQEPKVLRAGYRTLGDLARAEPRVVEAHLGDWGLGLQRLARGEDARNVVHNERAKSMSVEQTFAEDIESVSGLRHRLLDQSLELAKRMGRRDLYGLHVFVKLKDAKFKITTRRLVLSAPTCDPDVIYRAAITLLERFERPLGPIRLCGVGLSELSLGSPPPSLFVDPGTVKRRRLEEARRRLDMRFGSGALTRATLLERPG